MSCEINSFCIEPDKSKQYYLQFCDAIKMMIELVTFKIINFTKIYFWFILYHFLKDSFFIITMVFIEPSSGYPPSD